MTHDHSTGLDGFPPHGRLPARVGIVGVGRVGAVLGAALQAAGLDVVAAHGLSDSSCARAAALLPGVPLASPMDVARGADLVLLTVPDDPLAGLVSGLARHDAFRAGALVVHTSGRHGLAPLAAARRAGARTVAVHPAMTFTGTAADLPRLADTRFGVTADPADRPAADALVTALGGTPVTVLESARPLYHAALAHGANHLTTLVAEARDLLTAAGVEDAAGTLRPLLQAALDGALRDGDAALTGPVARGDAGTVAAHLAALAAVDPAAREVYATLARHTASRAVAAGRLRAVDAAPLLDTLAADRTVA
jgi:predicted short-subunit dehydrogenase-like oxidoreductase (DUF2520 family)